MSSDKSKAPKSPSRTSSSEFGVDLDPEDRAEPLQSPKKESRVTDSAVHHAQASFQTGLHDAEKDVEKRNKSEKEHVLTGAEKHESVDVPGIAGSDRGGKEDQKREESDRLASVG